MRRVTLALYLVFGVAGVVSGCAAILSPGLLVGTDQLTSLAAHLTQEQGALFVFVGLMCFWCVRHFEQRRPVHFSLLVVTVLFFAIHLQGYLAGHGAIRYVAANAAPSLLLALTAPWSRPQS
jgi:hypothetical protein